MTPNLPMAPRTRARAAGLFYLANIVTIFAAIFLFKGFAVPGDALATASNIGTHLGRYRLAFASQVMSTATSIGLAALLYGVFKPVDPGMSLMATLFRVLACALAAVGYVFQLAPLVVTVTPPAGLTPAETQAIVQMLAGFQRHTRNVSIAFFGCQFIVLAYLIARSKFLPRLLSVLLGVAGVGGLLFTAAPVSPALLIYFAPVGLAGELSLPLWLAARGVDAGRWREQARLAASIDVS